MTHLLSKFIISIPLIAAAIACLQIKRLNGSVTEIFLARISAALCYLAVAAVWIFT